MTGGLIVAGIGLGLLGGGLIGGSGLNYGFGAGAALGFTAAKVVRPTVQSRFGLPTAFQTRWLLERQRGIFSEREQRPEPELSSSEPPSSPESARIDRPAVVTQSSTPSPGGYSTNRVMEPAEPSHLVPGARFGRFQGLR